MYDPAALPGFLAAVGDIPGVHGRTGDGPPRSVLRRGPVTLVTWGVEAVPGDPDAFALSRVLRDADGAVAVETAAERMRVDPRSVTGMLPPFAAVAAGESSVTMVADSMGFRQLFHSGASDARDGVLSTSALLAGWTRGAGLDEIAVAVQSLLGWQLGQRALHDGVVKLTPGAAATLDHGGLVVDEQPDAAVDPIGLDDAVTAAAEILRASLDALIRDHPEAVLQLTGGMDSRVLLAAIPPERRRGLRAMTLGAPGDGDVRIAARIATEQGLRHEVYRPAELSDVDPAEAWAQCRAAALRLDGLADPLTLAVLGRDERSFDQGVRIAGLGGEVARGFYYLGAVRDHPVTAAEASRLGAWRMFANESIEPGVLTDEFSAWARDAAEKELLKALQDGSPEWFHATDALYLRHRMQRWAGATDTAVAYQRLVINPMLDERFLAIAGRLRPQDKAGARFLARLLLRLDPQLGSIGLEGRLSPSAYASPGPWQAIAGKALIARKLARKTLQRVRGANRAPDGVVVFADKVVEHWRADTALLEPLAATGFVREDWVDGVRSGRIRPRPSSVGFLTNVLVASRPLV
jgi:asparagine synthase (glutamine-hydrolysing)